MLKIQQMEKLDLTVFEKSQLIDNYKSELRKLEFQIEAAKSAIALLETGAPAVVPQVSIIDTEQVTIPATEQQAPKKRGPKPKEKVAETESASAQPEPAKEEAKPAAVKGKPGKKAGTKKASALKEEPVEEPVTAETTPEESSPTPKKGKGKGKAQKSVETAGQVEDQPAPAEKAEKAKKEKTEKKEKPKVAKAPKEKKAEDEGDRKKPGPKASMSFWDEFILEKLRAVGEGTLSSADLLGAMKSERDAKDLQLGNTQLSQLLNRSLHKLVHKMKLVASQQLAGRNFTYWAK